ncbi:MAG: hypothetical protein WKF34_13110 [Pyrinomonadaceae bacterium]
MNYTGEQLLRGGTNSRFGLDTLLVLIFLGIEYGRAVTALSMDGLLMGSTMLMVLFLPYFLPSRYDKPAFLNWVFGRAAFLSMAIVLGFGIGPALRSTLPFSPLTPLILVSMISLYVQFYALLRLRVAK